MLAIQALILLFSLFALVNAWRRQKRGKISRVSAVLWSLLWIAVGVVVMQPESTTFLAHRLGVGRGVDLVTYLALLFIFFLLFRLFSRIEELEQDITRLVREIALQRAHNDDETAKRPD